MELEMIALGTGVGILLLLAAMAARMRRRREREGPEEPEENLLEKYAHHQIGMNELVRRTGISAGYRVLTSVGKGGSMKVRIQDDEGTEVDSYETKNPNEQVSLMEFRDRAAHEGAHVRRLRGDTQYLKRKVRRRVPRE